MNDILKKIAAFFRPLTDFFKNIHKKGAEIGLWRAFDEIGHRLTGILGFVGRLALMALLTIMLTGTLLFLFGMVYISHYLNIDNDIDLNQTSLDQTSHIYAKDPDNPDNWIEVESISGVENRIWVPYEEIPEKVVNAVVAVEDKRFWNHNGVEWKRTFGAFYTMFLGDSEQYGGSSITQQLIKNLTKDDERTISRKLREIFKALEFEKQYDKEQIMEWYLNTIYLGSGCNGILTAADTYFGKTLDELTLAEAACLVGITNNPSRFDPFLHPNNNKQRQVVILRLMRKQQIITQEEYENAVLSPLVFKKSGSNDLTSNRSWYVDQALKDVTADLVEEWGWSEQMVTHYLYSSGVNIYLCVDADIQQALDDIWADESCWPESPDDEPAEAAMMICDPQTGNILAMIGGREKTGVNQFDRSTMAKRQPGSSIKPISVYAPAFEAGLITPYTPVDDIPVRIASDGNRGWPRNSPNKYEGRVSIMTGVTKSKNTVSIQTLQALGVEESFEFAKYTMGLDSLVDSVKVGDQYLSDMDESPLAFGALTYGATVREMTGAYNTFPNGGIRNKTRTYTHITDQNGAVVFENSADPQVAMQEKTAYYITQALYSAVNNEGGTGGKARIEGKDGIAIPVAGKTGTTSANKDRWFAGYTPYYTAVCWFGYDIPRDMAYYSSNPAVTMWQQVMESIHQDLERIDFPELSTAVQAHYCRDSGLLPTNACKSDIQGNRVSTGTFDKDDVPKESCNVHVMTNLCTVSNKIATPYCPTETLKAVSLRNMERAVPVSMALPDEQYTLRIWPDTKASYALPEGYKAPSLSTDKPANAFCNHKKHQPGAQVSPSPSPSPSPSSSPPPSPVNTPTPTNTPPPTQPTETLPPVETLPPETLPPVETLPPETLPPVDTPPPADTPPPDDQPTDET